MAEERKPLLAMVIQASDSPEAQKCAEELTRLLRPVAGFLAECQPGAMPPGDPRVRIYCALLVGPSMDEDSLTICRATCMVNPADAARLGDYARLAERIMDDLATEIAETIRKDIGAQIERA